MRHHASKADSRCGHAIFALIVCTAAIRGVVESCSGAATIFRVVIDTGRDTLDGLAGVLVQNLDFYNLGIVIALSYLAVQLARDNKLILRTLLHTVVGRVERAEGSLLAEIAGRRRDIDALIAVRVFVADIGIASVVGNDEVILIFSTVRNRDRYSRIDSLFERGTVRAVGFFQLFILCFLRRAHLVDLVLGCKRHFALEPSETLGKALREVIQIVGQHIQRIAEVVCAPCVAALMLLGKLCHQCVKFAHKFLCVGQVVERLKLLAAFVIGIVDLLQFCLRKQSTVNVLIAVVQLLLERGKARRKLVAGFRVHIDPHGSTSCHARQLLDLRAAGYIGVAEVALVVAQIGGVQMHPAGTIERDGHIAVCIGLIAGVKTRRGSVARGGSRSAAVLRGNVKLCAGERAVLARIVLQGRIRTGNVQRQRFALIDGQCAGDGYAVLLKPCRLHIAHGVVFRKGIRCARIGRNLRLRKQHKLYCVAVMQHITVGIVNARTILIVIVGEIVAEALQAMRIDAIDKRGIAGRTVAVQTSLVVELAAKLRFQCAKRLVARQRDRTRPCRACPLGVYMIEVRVFQTGAVRNTDIHGDAVRRVRQVEIVGIEQLPICRSDFPVLAGVQIQLRFHILLPDGIGSVTLGFQRVAPIQRRVADCLVCQLTERRNCVQRQRYVSVSVQRRGKFCGCFTQGRGIVIRLALIVCDVLRRRFNYALGVFLEQSVQIRICFGQRRAVGIDGLFGAALQIVVRLFAPLNRFIEIGGVDLANRNQIYDGIF